MQPPSAADKPLFSSVLAATIAFALHSPNTAFAQELEKNIGILSLDRTAASFFVFSLRDIDYKKARIKDCLMSNPCVVDVTVKVPHSGDGKKCEWDYPAIVVVKEKNTKITWKLKEISKPTTKAMFVYDTDKPGTGIDIHEDHTGKREYEKPEISGGDKEFSWTRKAAGFRAYRYDFNVKHTIGLKKCTPPDPLIINMD
jgi:hypothetical protein